MDPPPAFSSLPAASSSPLSPTSQPNGALTFKLCHKDDIRRLTVPQGEKALTFASLMESASEFSALVGFKLTWRDDEGDLITLRNQQDLEEALTFLTASGSSSLKLFIEEIEAPPYSARGHDEGDEEETEDRSDGEEDEDEDEDEVYEDEDQDEDEDHEDDFDRELRGVVGLADEVEPGRTETNLLSPKLRKRLEKYDAKLGKKNSKWNSKIQKLKKSPHFNEAEFGRQIQVLKDAQIPVYPHIRFLLAKRLVWTNKRIAKKGPNHDSSIMADIVDGRNSYIPHEKKLAKMLEVTRKQLEYLREHRMPTGWPIVTYLEFQNKQLSITGDELIRQQLADLRYLKNLPEPWTICILKAFNDRRSKNNNKKK